MPLGTTIGNDFQVVDGTSVATYLSRTSESGFAAGVTVNNTFGRAATKEDLLAAGAQLNQIGTVWHVWTSQLSGVVPKRSDVIIDPVGVRWSVIRVEQQTLQTRWKLTTIRERPA